ncbi:MAG: thioredoxin [Acidimicrobiales bacterium]
MSDNIITVNDDDFDEQVTTADVPVLVDFWAVWCGPCKMVAPILEEIAEDNGDKLRIAKLNVDDNQRTSQRFQVMSIPTLLLFKDGEAKHRIVGARPKSKIMAELEPFLN